MKKAHLHKWRQESTGVEVPDEYGYYEEMDYPETDSPAGDRTGDERQVSEISSTTSPNLGCLDLRTNVKIEDDSANIEALDLRTNVKSEHKLKVICSNSSEQVCNEALDLRICNVVSLKDANPIPSCVPESLSDCETSDIPCIEREQTCANDTTSALVSDSTANESTTSDSMQPIDSTITDKMLPMEIIEKFNLIRNLVIASNGLIPSNVDDPGGTKLEVAQEEIVETTTDDQVPGMSREAANVYKYNLHPVKLESGSDQTSDMDLSQRSVDISRQLLGATRNGCVDYAQAETLRQMQMAQVKMEPMFHMPLIKTEPGFGLGPNLTNSKETVDFNHNEQYLNNCVKVENIYPKGVIPSVVTSDDDEMEDAAVDSGTESCDSKDSVNNKNKGERKRPGRKKGQVSKVYHLWEFIRDMLANPEFCPKVIKWENEDEGIFRVVQSETVAALWGAKKNNRTKMTYEKMSRSIRYSRKEGYFADIPKNRGYPKKLCFKFGGKAHGWRKVK